MLARLYHFFRYRPLPLLAASSLSIAGFSVFWWYMVREPALPAEYQSIRLGMTLPEVQALLAPGGFQAPGKAGRGYVKGEVQTKECSELRWKNFQQWYAQYKRHSWHQGRWNLDVTIDQGTNLVAGKSLVLMDRRLPQPIREALEWFDRHILGRKPIACP